MVVETKLLRLGVCSATMLFKIIISFCESEHWANVVIAELKSSLHSNNTTLNASLATAICANFSKVEVQTNLPKVEFTLTRWG